MQVTCKRCRAPIPVDDVNLDRALAKCRACNAVFGIGDQLGTVPGVTKERATIAIPERFTTDDVGEGFRVSWRWFSPMYIFLAFFSFIWCSFLFGWYSMAMGMPGQLGPLRFIFFVFPLIHVAVGIGLAYFAVCGFFNTTTVEAGREGLSIRHAPLPWPGGRAMDAQDLDQLYAEERVHRGKNGVTTTYTLNAILRDGRQVALLTGLETADQALYLEQAIERRLGIRDRAVGGELPR